jgi:hypothetical protein
VSGTGHLTARDDGRFGFVAIELTAAIRTDAQALDAMERAAQYTERACLVSIALDVPVHVDASVRRSRPHSRSLASGCGSSRPGSVDSCVASDVVIELLAVACVLRLRHS